MEIEVDTFWIYFGGGISKTRFAVEHKGKKDIRKDPKILVCNCVDGNAIYFLKWT